MRTIIICSGGEDGKDVRTAIRIEDALFEKMFGSHIKDAMSFDEVELYLETAVEKIKSSYEVKLSKYEDMERIKEYLKFDCENVDRGKPLTEMSDKIKDLEDELDRRGREIRCLVKNSKAAREMSDKIKDLDARLEEMAKQRNYFKDELDKRDRDIEQLKEAVVRANENADSYYKLYSSERDAHRMQVRAADDLNYDFLEVREIVAKKCKQWSETIWNAINELDTISKCDKPDYNSPVMIIRGIADGISDFGANNAQGIMEGYEEDE